MMRESNSRVQYGSARGDPGRGCSTHRPNYKEKKVNSPPIAWRATFRFDKEGQLIGIHGFHSGYPAFEVWEYTGPKFGTGNPSSCAKMLYGYDPTLKKPPVDAKGLLGQVYFERLFK